MKTTHPRRAKKPAPAPSPPGPDAARAQALAALSELGRHLSSPGGVAALLDIAEAACRAVEDLWPEHVDALDAETKKRHFLPVLHTNLPPELAPTGKWPSDRLRDVVELKPYTLGPKRKKSQFDALDYLAQIFVARVLAETEPEPLGLEHFVGRAPIPDGLRLRLRSNRDLGDWSAALIDWIKANWPDAFTPRKEREGRRVGGAMIEIADERRKRQQTEAVSPEALLRQSARDVLKPLLRDSKTI